MRRRTTKKRRPRRKPQRILRKASTHKLRRHSLAGLIAILPPLTYGAGYLLWKAPGQTLFGLDLAPHLSVRALLEPGVVYLGSLLLAAVLAYGIGLERFARPLVMRFSWVRRLPREAIECCGWIGWLAFFAALLITYDFVNTRQPILDPVGNLLYLPIHLIVAAAIMRRLWGLLAGRERDHRDERRASSPVWRMVTASFAVMLLFAHILLALVFGALGPNPARRLTPVSIAVKSTESANETLELELLLIETTRQHILAYDPAAERALTLPTERVVGVTVLARSSRQELLLEQLRTKRKIDAQTAREIFPGRESIRSAEIQQLERESHIVRSVSGDIWSNAPVMPETATAR